MDLYRLLVERLDDFAVFLTDPAGSVTSWHPGVENLLGYKENEWIGKSTVIIFTPEDRAAGVPEREILRALREGQAPDIRWHQRKDGSRVYVEGTFVALKDRSGNVLGLAKVMRDVTERKRTEDDLRRAERRQAILLMLMAQQRESSDPVFMMQTAAEAVCRYLHADRARFQSLSSSNRLEFRAGWTAGRIPLLTEAVPVEWMGAGLIGEVSAGRTVGIFDVRLDPLTADSRLPGLGVAALIGAPILRKGRWLGGLMVNHAEPRVWTGEEVALVREVADLTWDAVERARAEEARRVTEERLTLSLEAAGAIGTWDWNVALDKVYPSERFARMFSLDADEIASGVPLSRLAGVLHPDDRARVIDIIRKAVDTASPYVADYRVLQTDGSLRWLHALGRAYNDADGKPARFPGAAVDITDLKEMEQALRRSEDFNSRILESTPDCVKVLGLDGTLLSMNGRGQQQLGIEDWRRFKGTSWLDFWKDPADRAAAEAAVARARQGMDGQFEGFLATLRGEPRWWDSRITSIPGADGAPESLLAISRDITDRKRAEDELKEARDNANSILQSITDGFFVLDSEWRFTFANRAAEEMLGLTSAELLGKSHWELYPTTVGSIIDRMYHDAVREQKPVEFETFYDPWQRWFSVKASPTKVGALSVFFRDVTTQKNADAELRKQWHLFDTVLSHTPDFSYTFDLRGRFTYVNRALQSLLQQTLEELVGKNFFDLNYPPELAARLERQINQVIESRRTVRDYTPYTGPNGEPREYEYILVPVLSAEGAVEAVAGSTRDITDQKRAEERERERQAQLLDSARLESLGVMAGGIAHDFNNLLVGVLGNASLLLETTAPADRPLAGEIVLAAERAAELTKQMLAYSGKGHFAVEVFDLNALIQENLTLLRSTLARNVSVELDFGCAACLVEADRTQIQQVAMNLIINASEAVGDKPGKVQIRTEMVERSEARANAWLHAEAPPGTYAMLEVRDTGVGMTQETMKKIFDPFFSTKFTGRGLGLAAVLGIIRGHQGDIEVESEPGVGTTFRVCLAAAKGQKAARRDQPEGATATGLRGRTVLVVDDEDIVRRVAASALRSRGFHVTQAANGAEALEILRKKPDTAAIVLDLTMPVMTGEQALPLIRAEFPNIPVILSSGFGESEILSRFSEPDIAGVLQKPYTVSAIVSAVTAALEGERRQD